MINCYLLFHKCGNNYVLNVHRIDKETSFVKSVRPHEAADIAGHDRPGVCVNIRCRNFGSEALEATGLMDDESARFLIFTRDPASFIISAAKYHLRGGEQWATGTAQEALSGQTLTQALRSADTPDDQQIVIMKQFDYLYKQQVSLLKYLSDSRFMRVRCEDIFTSTENAYFAKIASFLRCSAEPSYVDTSSHHAGSESRFLSALKAASPAFMQTLPHHSTGSFVVESPYHALGAEAKQYYNAHWKEYARALGYGCGD